ncbi:MAG: rhomboid family intramembrane serine protease [Saprospiraceae bacterium]|nr:rhomboid family intramembrane serine protease [Saprospiraceae bacterium]
MGQITDVVKHLLLINIVAFIATITLLPDSRFILAMYYPASEYFSPYQVVTHMFMHADLGHLFFNMLTLFFLGPWVERRIGSRKFLIFYLASGFGAAGLHLLVRYYLVSQLGYMDEINIPVLGASGAVYGVLAAFGTLFPNARLMLLFPPIPIRASYLAIGLILFDLITGVSGTRTGVAHFAHVGGAITGFLLILYWIRSRSI